MDGPSPMDVESDDVCWICLDDKETDTTPMMSPCKCPRKVHPRCLARWQLQQAGRPEETHCRFCNSALADWKASLTPDSLKPDVQKVQPVMVVYFEGEIHRIPVKQGADGLQEFTDRIRQLFRLPGDVDISLTFGCKEPLSGQHLKLEGIGAFDAAVHCASVAAAERQQKLRTTTSAGGASSASTPKTSSAGAQPGAAQGSRSTPAADAVAASTAAAAPGNPSQGGEQAPAAGADHAAPASQRRNSCHPRIGQQGSAEPQLVPTRANSLAVAAAAAAAAAADAARAPQPAARPALPQGWLESRRTTQPADANSTPRVRKQLVGGGTAAMAATAAAVPTTPTASSCSSSDGGGDGYTSPAHLSSTSSVGQEDGNAEVPAQPQESMEQLMPTEQESPRDRRMCRSPSMGGMPLDVAAPLTHGSITGRFKYSLRAFSRKVARSLHLSNEATRSSEQNYTEN